MIPDWVPASVRSYLAHTDGGVTLRQLAREHGVHPSTVMRQVRRTESLRDDPLVDQALAGLSHESGTSEGKGDVMDTGIEAVVGYKPVAQGIGGETLMREAQRVLGRMSETGAVMLVSADMERAAVMRQTPEGKTQRLCTLERSLAQVFALNDWIACDKPARVSVYRLTVAGRAMVRRARAAQFDAPFGSQHRHMEMHELDGAEGRMRIRVNMAESPIVMLGRKRDKDGKPYLDGDLIRVAERLREDFELAQMGPRVAQNWERFLTAGDRGGFRSDSGLAEGPRAARERVLAALADLGPGLGDVVLRVCCFVEGIETTERHMGWAARSGKIVLRIALQRLKRHYEELYGPFGPRFG